jgi:putative FmdB family regulatory protein
MRRHAVDVACEATGMPIYEFYCRDCHRLFNFLSRRIETTKRPACPRCRRPELERRASAFAISRGRKEPAPEGEGAPDIDEARLERALTGMAGQLDSLDEENPRQAVQMMRQLFEAAGMPMGGGMEEAFRRIEAGEDPESVEAELGDALEDPFTAGAEVGRKSVKDWRRRLLPPSVDSTLYEL